MDAQYAAAYPHLYRHHWWWRVREEILLGEVRRLVNGDDRGPARILDVGCGAALFFDALAPFGHVEGVESDASAIAHAGRWRDRIFAGDLDASFVPQAPFDLILMLDVLEHVGEPEALLARARDILAPGGRLLLTVPAFTWLWTTHDEINAHVRRYTAGQVRQALERSGFVALEVRYLFQSLVVPKLAVRLSETLTSRPPRVPRVPPPFINRAAQSWFRVEHALAGWLPFGASVLAIAKAV